MYPHPHAPPVNMLYQTDLVMDLFYTEVSRERLSQRHLATVGVPGTILLGHPPCASSCPTYGWGAMSVAPQFSACNGDPSRCHDDPIAPHM